MAVGRFGVALPHSSGRANLCRRGSRYAARAPALPDAVGAGVGVAGAPVCDAIGISNAVLQRCRAEHRAGEDRADQVAVDLRVGVSERWTVGLIAVFVPRDRGYRRAHRVRARSLARVALAGMAGAWSGYLVFIGGDIFPAYRHFVPLMVIFAFALAEGAGVLAERLHARPLLLYSIALVTIAFYVPFAQRQVADKHSVRAVRERWEWQGKEVALLLKRAFHVQQPLLAVTAAGSLPYWSELPALDMLGLNDYYLPRHPPADMGTGFLGHELGDAEYVLRRNPDIIVFTVGSPPEFHAGRQLAAAPAFHERYSPVMVRTQPLEYLALIYFNKYSNKLGMGIIDSDTTVTVPGFLFTGKDSIAHLNDESRLVASISSGQALGVVFITDAQLAGSAVEVRSSDPSSITAEVQQHESHVAITLRSTGAAAEIEEVILRKL